MPRFMGILRCYRPRRPGVTGLARFVLLVLLAVDSPCASAEPSTSSFPKDIDGVTIVDLMGSPGDLGVLQRFTMRRYIVPDMGSSSILVCGDHIDFSKLEGNEIRVSENAVDDEPIVLLIVADTITIPNYTYH